MPRSTDPDTRIRNLTDEFVSQLSVVIHEAALEAVREAVEGITNLSGPPTRRKKKATRTAGRKKTGRRKKRGRRSSHDTAAMAERILAYVRANSGTGAGDIARAVGSTTTGIRPVTQGLIADGKLRTTGQRRGTKYFTGSGGGRKTGGRKKAGRKKAGRKKAGRRKTSRRSSGSLPAITAMGG